MPHKHIHYVSTFCYSGERARLKEDAVPSVFPFTSTTSKRRQLVTRIPLQPSICDYQGVQHEVIVESSNNETENLEMELTPDELVSNESVQCTLLGRFSIENIRTDPKAINYYTGFSNFDHFLFFFYCLGPAASDLKNQPTIISPLDQLFLTVIKLRQAKEDYELSLMFEISETTVSKIIVMWINFMYFQLKELDIWPSREIIDKNMPEDFQKKFPTTRVILDATEIPIQKPSDVNAQSITWSSYKHRNTLKTMIGCTPRGAVSFISESFGGSASDRQIIECSNMIKPESNMFLPKDSIMADRGIMVQDLFAPMDVYVNTPTMLKGKSQLEPKDVVRDRRIASKRIHIERVIDLSKTYKILSHPLPSSKCVLGSRIVFVCFSLSNFRKPIVDGYA